MFSKNVTDFRTNIINIKQSRTEFIRKELNKILTAEQTEKKPKSMYILCVTAYQRWRVIVSSTTSRQIRGCRTYLDARE